MASGGKSKASSGGAGEKAKRRRVAFSGDVGPPSCNANECLKLHIALAGQELQDEGDEYTFDPEFSERIFGEEGKIYGYKDLKIDLWLHASTFYACVQIQYTSKRSRMFNNTTVNSQSAGGKKTPCTDVLAKLKEVFGDALTEDKDSFQQNLQAYSDEFEETVVKNGKVVSSWRSEASSSALVTEANTDAEGSSESPGKLTQILRVELAILFKGLAFALDSSFSAIHRRYQANLNGVRSQKQDRCFQDTGACFGSDALSRTGAQQIEIEDPLWEVYLALEGEGPEMKVAGFCNVYRFYHYPDSTRLRISQILVLPPYQGLGFGLRLVEAVNSAATARSCYDVTMEEPSMTLQKLRDTMDVLRLLSLPSIDEAIKDAVSKLQVKKELVLYKNGSEVVGDQSGALVNFNGTNMDPSSPKSRASFKEKSILLPPAQLVDEVREKLKISKMQFKRCWEQIIFLNLDKKDRDLQDVFQEALVQRLNSEIFQKESGNKTGGKRVIDTDNEHDNTKTFVMMRRKKNDAVAGNGGTVPEEESQDAGEEVQALTPGPEERGKVLQEELKQREDELLDVAQAVARHCKTLGLNIPSMKVWEQVVSETSEVVS